MQPPSANNALQVVGADVVAPPGSNVARNMVRRRPDEGETGAKKDQGSFQETMHDGMDPGQISVPSIFDFPSAEELDASLTPTGLFHLVVLPLDFQTLADAVRIAVSKGAKMLAADLHSTSEVACVKHLFGSTDHHGMSSGTEASMPRVPRCHAASLRKRIAATLYIMSLRRHVELRNTLKNLAQAHPGGFQVPCDIDLRSYDETPDPTSHQIRESWHQQNATVALPLGGLGEGGWVLWSDILRDPKELAHDAAGCAKITLRHALVQAVTPASEVANAIASPLMRLLPTP